MNTSPLLDCLMAVGAPDGVEEWLVAAQNNGHHDAQRADSAAPVDSAYRQGVRDVLTALGIVSADSERASTPMAYYFIQSLICAAREGTFGAEAWRGSRKDKCKGAGARLVRVMEETRLSCSPEPMPLRIVRAATAVIKARQDGKDVYLMQYDEKAQQFQPLGGKQELTDKNSEAALARELCEELLLTNPITQGVDFKLHPLAVDLQVDEISASLNVMTRYYHSFYHLTDVRFPLPIDNLTRWLTYDELIAMKTTDGYAVSDLFQHYIPGVLETLAYSV